MPRHNHKRDKLGQKLGETERANPAEARQVVDPSTPPDVTDPRGKSSRHRKGTADKWNQ